MPLFWITGSIVHVTGSLLHENPQSNSTFRTVTESCNALKPDLRGQSFADHDKLLAMYEKVSSQVLITDLQLETHDYLTILCFFLAVAAVMLRYI